MLLVGLEGVDRCQAQDQDVDEHLGRKLTVESVPQDRPQYDGADQGHVRYLVAFNPVYFMLASILVLEFQLLLSLLLIL